MKKIAVVTGIRADYGILHSIIQKIRKSKKLQLKLIVTGSHLSHQYGYTIKEIQKEKIPIAAKVDMLLSDDTGARMSRSLGVGTLQFTQVFEMLKPDITLVMGDREEMFAAAIASLCMDIPIAHIHGGEIGTGGHIDEAIRHALTKFAHIHFAATQKSAERIKKLGEEDWRVHFVGAPFMDNIQEEKISNPKELQQKYGINTNKPLIIVIQHPLAIEAENSKKQMETTMNAVTSFKLPTIVIYPNADAGGQAIIEVIKSFEKHPFIRAFKNFPPQDYLGLMKLASVIVGNSSSAIIESPAFNLPAINIGQRQLGREMSENIINVPYSEIEIKKAIKKCLFDKSFLNKIKNYQTFYGSGDVAKKIVDILTRIEINNKLLHKKMTF